MLLNRNFNILKKHYFSSILSFLYKNLNQIYKVGHISVIYVHLVPQKLKISVKKGRENLDIMRELQVTDEMTCDKKNEC